MVIKTLIALLVVASHADTVNLTPAYAEGGTRTYEISASDKGSGAKLEGKLRLKALSATKDGKTSVQLSGPCSMIGPGGQSQDADLDLKQTLDKNGMPVDLSVEGGDVVGTLLSLASFLPGTEVEVGKSFTVDWKSSDKTLTGTGTLTSIEEKDGVKVATLSQRTSFKPGDETPATLVLVSKFDLATGALLSCTGTVVVEGQVNLDVVIKSTK